MCIRKSVSDPFGEPVNLGPAVNTSDEEYCPEISADSLTLLPSLGSPGWQGNHDVWMSTRNSVDVPFGEPVNLGPPINTNAKDGHPTLSSDGLTLIYSSNRQCTPGDSDLWMSTRKSMSVPFGVPVNLGSTVNTNTWEGGPALSSDSLTLFFASGSPDGYGSSDLWMARIVRPGEATSTESSQPPLAIPDNPDRQAAEWVLGIGGDIVVLVDGKKRWISEAENLPQDNFVVVECHLLANKLIGVTGLRNLRGLSELHTLLLNDAALTDAGLQNLGEHPKLEYLNLTNTSIGDAGLRCLKGLRGLHTLTLIGTEVSDKGVEHLTGLQHLTILGIEQTRITGDGIKTLPELRALNVSDSFLTEDNVANLNQSPHLKKIRVFGKRQQDVKCLSGLRGLEHLCFQKEIWKLFTKSDLAALKTALPNCVIGTDKDEYDAQSPAESPKPAPTPEPDPTSEMQTEKNDADNTPKISWKLRHTLEDIQIRWYRWHLIRRERWSCRGAKTERSGLGMLNRKSRFGRLEMATRCSQ